MCRTQPSPGSHPAHTWLHLCSSSQKLQEENAATSLLMDKVCEPCLPWHFGFWCRAAAMPTDHSRRRFGVLGVFPAAEHAWEAPTWLLSAHQSAESLPQGGRNVMLPGDPSLGALGWSALAARRKQEPPGAGKNPIVSPAAAPSPNEQLVTAWGQQARSACQQGAGDSRQRRCGTAGAGSDIQPGGREQVRISSTTTGGLWAAASTSLVSH